MAVDGALGGGGGGSISDLGSGGSAVASDLSSDCEPWGGRSAALTGSNPRCDESPGAPDGGLGCRLPTINKRQNIQISLKSFNSNKKHNIKESNIEMHEIRCIRTLQEKNVYIGTNNWELFAD